MHKMLLQMYNKNQNDQQKPLCKIVQTLSFNAPFLCFCLLILVCCLKYCILKTTAVPQNSHRRL